MVLYYLIWFDKVKVVAAATAFKDKSLKVAGKEDEGAQADAAVSKERSS